MSLSPIKNPLLIHITGNGKGKTTSALGMAVRFLGWGGHVEILQFIKGTKKTGESTFFETQTNATFHRMGLGRDLQEKFTPAEHRDNAQIAWEKAKEILLQGSCDFLILDELNIAIAKKWVLLDDVLDFFKAHKLKIHVAITGRYGKAALSAISDLVSEIHEIKHPYQTGTKVQKGIDF